MRLFGLSDTHMGHKLMHDLGVRPPDYEYRVLKGLNVLEPDDVFIHFGDICIGNDKCWNEIFGGLPCKKWLIKGNHDRKSYGWYLNYWDVVCDSMIIVRHGMRVLLSHKPQYGDHFDYNIHGHIHHGGHEHVEDERHILIELETNLNLRNIDSLIQRRLRND